MFPRGEQGGGLHVLHGKCQFSPNLSNFNNINSVTIIIFYLFQGASLGSEEASASATAGKGRAPFSRPPPHRRCNRKGFQVHLLINFASNRIKYFWCSGRIFSRTFFLISLMHYTVLLTDCVISNDSTINGKNV